MAGDARAAAEQQLVAFEGRGAVEVGVAGTGLTEQMLGNEAAQIHRLLVLTEPLHQLLAAHTEHAAGHHRLDRGQRGATVEAGGIVASKLTPNYLIINNVYFLHRKVIRVNGETHQTFIAACIRIDSIKVLHVWFPSICQNLLLLLDLQLPG